MDQLQKNFAIACLCILAVVFFTNEFMTHFFFQQPIDSLVSQNQAVIAHIYASAKPQATIHNPYFELALPSGMEVFAIDNNNFRLRYQRFYFEVHTFTSKVDSNEYSKAKFPVERVYDLAKFNNQPVFFYVKPLEQNVSQLALYTNNLEITATVPNAALETTLLKSVELMRNITPLATDEGGILIGGDDGVLPNQGGLDLDREKGADNSANTEMPLVH